MNSVHQPPKIYWMSSFLIDRMQSGGWTKKAGAKDIVLRTGYPGQRLLALGLGAGSLLANLFAIDLKRPLDLAT